MTPYQDKKSRCENFHELNQEGEICPLGLEMS